MKRSDPPLSGSISPPPTKRRIESNTTSKAVSNFFKPPSAKDPSTLKWRIVDKSLVVGRYEPTDAPPIARGLPVKVAAFDFDDTLIVATTGNKWARSPQSWKWWDPSVPARLKSLHAQGYLIVVFSNQGNVSLKPDSKSLSKDRASLDNLKKQVEVVFAQLDIPMAIYGATESDRYRKPRVGMWDAVLEDYGLSSEKSVDLANSFFVGDAAGREKTDNRRKDHANSDRDFAANVDIRFFTPEEFFLEQANEPYIAPFVPAHHLATPSIAHATNGDADNMPPTRRFTKANAQELVIFCGSPGAGKSTFFWDVLEPLGYQRVNQDTLKTRDRCIKQARDYLAAGLSVAVDNTNADIETRAHWVRVAREFSVPIRCVRFTASSRLAEHNDAVRAFNPHTMNPEKRTKLPGIAFASFVKRFQEPSLGEGFDDIFRVDFEFKGTDDQKRVWSRHWVDKFST